MATKRGCKKRGKAAPRKRSGPCGPKLKRKSTSRARRRKRR